jgi:hypothetical protein
LENFCVLKQDLYDLTLFLYDLSLTHASAAITFSLEKKPIKPDDMRQNIYSKILRKAGLVFMLIIASVMISQAQKITYSTPGPGTFTVPTGVTEITVEVWGGGGRGAGMPAAGGGGAGGGGGAYSRETIVVTPGTTYNFFVGAGSSTAAPGGDSWFINATTLMAKGGNSAADGATTGATGGDAASGFGTIRFSGGNGGSGTGTTAPIISGGGGSSAGSAADGNNGGTPAGGIAPTNGGNGGPGIEDAVLAIPGTTDGNGSGGAFPGGGGGGGLSNVALVSGGAGGNGKVTVSFGIIYDTPGTVPYVVPVGVNFIRVETWGAGGAGGDVTGSGSEESGGGGGGGAYSRSIVAVIPGQTYNITVGAGGISGLVNGGDSFIELSTAPGVPIVLAKGGLGVAPNTDVGGLGGDAALGIGTIKFSGGAGSGCPAKCSGGGGGASAGVNANGNPGGIPDQWDGGVAVLGGGTGGDGNNGPARGPGSPGLFPGGGGGGARKPANPGNFLGGVGAPGKVVITATSGLFIWDGETSTDPSVGTNWVADVAPAAGDDIQIPDVSAGSNRYPVYTTDWTFGDVDIQTGATLSMAPNTVFNLNIAKSTFGGGKLILESDATGDASIGFLDCSCTFTVSVVQERYIAGGNRAFRFLSHPYETPIALSVIDDFIDITGEDPGANGFTATSTNNPSAFFFSNALASGNADSDGTDDAESDTGWQPFTNISQTINRHQAILLMIRGSKGQENSLLDTDYVPDPVTIRWEGTINRGPQTITLSATDLGATGVSDFNLVGNPYPSAIDMSTAVHSESVTNYYVWRPRTGTISGRVYYGPGGGRGGSYLNETFAAPSQPLPKDAGFFVKAGNVAGATLSFTENSKTTATPAQITNLLRVDEELGSRFGANSIEMKILAEDLELDRLLIFFNNEAGANSKDLSDGTKMANPDMNFFTVSEDDFAMSIDSRPYNEEEDHNIIPIHVNAPAFTYTVQIPNFDLEEGKGVRLYDRFTEEFIEVKKGQSYTFSITDDPQSSGHRFDLIMGVEVVTSLRKLQDELKVFLMPNPAEQQVAITFQRRDQLTPTEVRILDLQGITIHQTRINRDQEARFDFPVNQLRKGIYLVEVVQGSAKQVKRLIVK